MKRKRGHKKGNKSKKPKVISDKGNPNESADNVESQKSDKSSEVAAGHDNSEHESRMEVDAPSSTGSDHSLNVSVDPDGSADNTAAKSIGRVKVKLKTSKAPEPDISSHDNIIKSSPQKGSEKSGIATEKREDYIPPLPERKSVFVGNVYRKTKGIKIKSSKSVAGSSSSIENTSDPVKTQEENVVRKDLKTPNENSETNKQEPENEPISLHKEQKKTDQTSRYHKQEPESAVVFLGKEQKKTDSTSQYNKQELEDSLTVIKKVMKMDAAEPFNVPVNPEALGIPDYFDIIHTPMDLGTICNNLERGEKFKNSEDVYKDVQFIWGNCSKYNKKGDYILDLMKRVKKNFMKYWTAAGLYTEHSTETQLEDGAQSSHGKGSTKGSQSRQKSHKRHGRHHKSDCMCAICILKRRKREREQNVRIAPGQSGAQEESSPVASPSIENSSLNMGEEQDLDTDVDNRTGGNSETIQLDSPMEEKQKVTEPEQESEDEEEGEGDADADEEDDEIEIGKKNEADDKHKTHSVVRSAEERGGQPVTDTADKSDVVVLFEGQNSTRHEAEDEAIQLQKQKELRELRRKEWRAKMHEKFHIENPQLLSLCETLFPDKNCDSIWSGPRSLFNRRGSTQRSSIHKAIESFMK